ncbi:hypothetical protein COCON_G00041220 [Conger conger]|uniref:Ig-like domain-containing protein n=1 Tax=Conger conger TaxID=82655 RepID=A0A9Q1DTL2_CONCO|nr:hypothetical protein COCON_G00041220 [Conger conger]
MPWHRMHPERISKTDIELIIIDAVSQPEIRSSCTLDGHTLLACSVDRGDHVRLQWIGLANLSHLPQQPAQTMSGRTLYLLGSTPGHVVCVAENPVSKKSSRTTVRRCRGRIPACIACGLLFSVLVCSMAWLKLYRSPTRHSVDTEGNIYLTMQGFQERRPENREVEVDNNIYVTCASVQAVLADTSKVTQKTSP